MTETATARIPDDHALLQGSGDLLFGHLAVEIVHSIFQLALELDRVHDYDVPFEALDRLRIDIFILRCVSALWNKFILSSPRYWCAVNLRGPQAAMARTIKRAQTVPLCVYSVHRRLWPEPVRMHFDQIQIRPMLLARRRQIRTLRLDDKDLYDFGMSIICSGLPNIRTLEMAAYSYLRLDERLITCDMPQLRHFTSRACSPPSDCTWIPGLNTLVFRQLNTLDLHLYRTLDVWAHGLKKLFLGLESSWQESPGIPATISFPHLEELRLDMMERRTAMEVTRRIRVPSSASGVIRVTLRGLDLEVVQTLLDFLFPEESDTLNSELATIEIPSEKGTLMAKYTRGSRSLQLRVGGIYRAADHEAIRSILQALHLRLRHPLIQISCCCDKRPDLRVLRLFSSSNVQSIFISAPFTEELMDIFARTIGRRILGNPQQVGADEGDWGFQSVRYLNIDCNLEDIEIERMVQLITTRQEQMRAKGRTCLEELVLGHRYPERAICSGAVAKLGAVGIMLREVDKRPIVTFKLDKDIL